MDTTSLRQRQPNGGFLPRRDRFACDRCGRLGSRCRTGAIGYCNRLARADRQLCPTCTKSIFDFGKTSAAWTLVGVVVGLIRGRK